MMKVIDLAVMTSNDELPDKTKVIFKKHNTECIYHRDGKKFEFVNKGDWNNYFYGFDFKELNDEVEIIEEKPKEIEELNISKMLQRKKWKRDKDAWNKLNEIIHAVNYLLKKEDSNDHK